MGEWCKLHSRKEKWKNLDAIVLPYHWDDRNKLYADFLYLKDFYERLLSDLTVKLNEIHGVRHSKRYWRILIGPWLGYFSQMLFDRWTTIHQAAENYKINGTIFLQSSDEDLVPNDMVEFSRLFTGDRWNHFIYSKIIQKTTNIKFQFMNENDDDRIVAAIRKSYKERIKKSIAGIVSRFLSFFSSKNDVFFFITYLTFFKELKLQLRFKQFPQFWRAVPTDSNFLSEERRKWSLDGKSNSDFETFVRYIIPKQIPKLYLEGYINLIEKTKRLAWPQSSKVIWTSNAHSADDIFKAWAAEKIEIGSKLIIGQHGGHYGCGKWSFIEDHEVAISDRYLSWGWDDPARSNIKPIGQIKGKKPLGIDHSKEKRSLLVTAIVPRYSYHMFSSIVAGQWESYQEDLLSFAANLSEPIRKTLLIRLHSEDYKWNQRERWKERFPEIELNDGRSDINELIAESRLYISTYNATTFLESFTMNIPTVIFWNPKYWELRDSAIPYFDELKEVGILHSSPESAALHVIRIWDHLEDWWKDEQVQSVRKRFCLRYSNLTENILDKVEVVFKEVVSG